MCYTEDLDLWKKSDRRLAVTAIGAAAVGGRWVVNERGENPPGNGAPG